MASIIDYFKNNKINFTASSSSCKGNNYSPYNVFDKSDSYFQSSGSSSGQYWETTFAVPVSISSYTISDSPGNNWLKKWSLSYSIDGKEFTHIRDDSHNDLRNAYANFSFDSLINCKVFRITHVENTASSNVLYFSYFNCYGPANPIARKRNRNSCNFIGYKYKLISNALMAILPSTIGV